MIRVDLDAVQRSARGELHDRPVVARAAPATSLPAVSHVGRSARHDEMVPVSEEHVADEEGQTAVLRRGEVDLGAGMVTSGIEVAFAVHAKAGDTAVREDVEAKMREWGRGQHGKQVPRVALERRSRQNLRPASRARDRFRVAQSTDKCRVD